MHLEILLESNKAFKQKIKGATSFISTVVISVIKDYSINFSIIRKIMFCNQTS